MHALWGKATTTGGAGNLTLAAISGYPTPYQAAGNRLFPYVALSAQEAPLEAGWGYMSSSTVFVRTRVVATYNGTSMVQGNLTPSTLPNGARICCSPHAASVESVLPVVDDSSGVGRFLISAHRNAATASATPTSLRIHYQAFQLRAGAVISSIAFQVTTAAAAGGQALAAMYALTAAGGVGSMIPGTDTAAIAVDSTGFKVASVSSPTFVPAGMYVVAFVYSGSSLVLSGHNSAGNAIVGSSPFGMVGNSNNLIEYRYESAGSLALPSSAGTTTASQLNAAAAPMMFLGVQ